MKKLTAVREFRLKLYPEDFYKVKNFYIKLGYEVTQEWDRDESKGVMFNLGGTTLELLWPGDSENEYRADISLEVEDVWKLYEEIKDKPFVIQGLTDNPWGDTSIKLNDPEGFQITFFTITEN